MKRVLILPLFIFLFTPFHSEAQSDSGAAIKIHWVKCLLYYI